MSSWLQRVLVVTATPFVCAQTTKCALYPIFKPSTESHSSWCVCVCAFLWYTVLYLSTSFRCMSQLPQINMIRKKPTGGSPTPSSSGPTAGASTRVAPSANTSPLEALQSFASDPSIPSDVRRRLLPITQALEREKLQRHRDAKVTPLNVVTPSHVGGASSTNVTASAGPSSSGKKSPSPAAHTAATYQFFSELARGQSPLRALLQGNPREAVRASNYQIALSRFQNASGSPRSSLFARGTAALQDPREAFAAMNRIQWQSLRFVESVSEMEFDVTNVREADGTVMKDPERLFLSVCCSVFAHFAFMTSLKVDLKKLVHFFSDLFKNYSPDNSYHNAVHAADSLQMASLFFRESTVNFLFSDEEILTAFLAVLTNDVAHSGVQDSSLALLNHPLVAVFGDGTTNEHISLIVTMHELQREENFFLPETFSSLGSSLTRNVIRETLYDIVMGASMRFRPFLMSELQRIGGARCVRQEDIPSLLSALLMLADNSFVLRPRRQCVGLGMQLCVELCREADELTRRNLPCGLPASALREEGVSFLTAYGNAVVRGVADAVRGLIPPDLWDHLERNTDVAHSARNEAEEAQAARLLQSSVTEDTDVNWDDNTAAVTAILSKATTHASSLDRKASKRAILNASPSRSSQVLGMERFSGLMPTSVQGGGSNPTSPATCGGSPTSIIPSTSTTSASGASPPLAIYLGTSTTELESFSTPLHATVSGSHPSRSEHYFSFLRLYDECEREGRSSEEFCGKLVFLALQLDQHYIASSAREEYGDNYSGADCRMMARQILASEEAPTTAEAIASRLPGSSCPRFSNDDETDGFILYLMDMYCRRELESTEAAGALLPDDEPPENSPGPVFSTMPGGGPVARAGPDANSSMSDNSSTGTQPPSEKGTPLEQYITGRERQQDSPLRLPVTTENGSFLPSFQPQKLTKKDH